LSLISFVKSQEILIDDHLIPYGQLKKAADTAVIMKSIYGPGGIYDGIYGGKHSIYG
jgi:hypothetical protein